MYCWIVSVGNKYSCTNIGSVLEFEAYYTHDYSDDCFFFNTWDNFFVHSRDVRFSILSFLFLQLLIYAIFFFFSLSFCINMPQNVENSQFLNPNIFYIFFELVSSNLCFHFSLEVYLVNLVICFILVKLLGL